MKTIKYEKDQLKKIDWDEYESYIDKIHQEVSKYLEENNLEIDVIVPILRGGGIPGINLAYKFNALRILPFQEKYFKGENELDLKKILNTKFSDLVGFDNKKPLILVVEGNHSTGTIASDVIKEIKNKLPSSKIIYVALGKDYFYKDSVKDVDFTTCGYYTNENQKLSKEECEKLNVVDKLYIFPWESFDEELAELNNEEFDYKF